ncbi:MAG: hypothetical protein GDA40_01930 [Rhodobacteraceae bacterium]|nr:hypothetical protein [Paracoccaceae bacterium]
MRTPTATIKGACPDAYKPMPSEYGLLVRVKPALVRLSRKQALGLCAAAQRFGNGVIDMTNRANLQIRGVQEQAPPDLLRCLRRLGLAAMQQRFASLQAAGLWQTRRNSTAMNHGSTL